MNLSARLSVAVASLMMVFGATAGYADSLVVAGRTVDVDLVAETGAATPSPAGPLTVTTKTVSLQPNSSVTDILLGARIVPDSEALALLYDLNPRVADLKSLPPGTQLVVPDIVVANGVAGIPEGRYARFTLDRAIRDDLNSSVQTLGPLTTTFTAGVGANSDGASRAVADKATTLAKWFEAIRRTYLRRDGPPLRRATLVNLRDEAAALRSIEKGSTALTIRAADRAQTEAIYNDVKSDMNRFGQVLSGEIPAGEPLCDVIVRIVGGRPDRVAKLRVYYATNGMYRDPPRFPPVVSYPFSQLGSGNKVTMPTRNYRFWAAADSDPGHPLTKDLFVFVTPLSTTPIPVDLLLKQR